MEELVVVMPNTRLAKLILISAGQASFVRGPKLAQRIARNCPACVVARAITLEQEMADQP